MDNSTVVSPGMRIRGTVTGKGPVTFGGQLDGELALEGELRVMPRAELTADIRAEHVTIEGVVRGHVRAARGIVVASGAEVEGAVEAERVEIDPKARVKAKLVMALSLPRGVSSRAARRGLVGA